MIVCKRGLSCLILFAVSAIHAQQIKPFKSGDRIAFVGNSITDGGHYHSYIWLYYMTHFPKERITCLNAGIGGDVVGQMYTRFQEDVLSKKPNIITLTWGMNDTRYFEWLRPDGASFMAKDIETSYLAYRKLEQVLQQQKNTQKILIGGSPYDETTRSNPKNLFPGKSNLFAEVIEFQKKAAQKNNWGFVDFYHPMLSIEKQEQAKDSLFSLTPGDRIHPDNDGHMVMAYIFLKDQGLVDKPVATVTVDATSGKIIEQINCGITNAVVKNNIVTFDYLAASLPYPLDTVPRGWGNIRSQMQGLRYVPFEKEFNHELLSIKNLPVGNYQLTIDKRVIGIWNANDFSNGINLAEQTATPQYQQALQVATLNEERWDIERQLRMYEWMKWNAMLPNKIFNTEEPSVMDSVRKYAQNNPFIKGNMDNFSQSRFKNIRDSWQKQMNVLIDKIYSINKPVKHHIVIVKR